MVSGIKKEKEARVRLLICDTETTGPDPSLAKICELGMILVDTLEDGSLKVVKEDELFPFETLINPGEPIPPEASAVNHITNKMVADAPLIFSEEVVDSVSAMVASADMIVAHNLPYDYEILNRELPDIFGKFSKSKTRIDTLRLAKHALPSGKSYALQVLRYQYELECEGEAHRALFDVELCQKVLELCQERSFTPWDKIPERANKAIYINIMYFGKYRGRYFDEVMAEDPDYFRWFMRQDWRNEHSDLVFTVTMHWRRKKKAKIAEDLAKVEEKRSEEAERAPRFL